MSDLFVEIEYDGTVDAAGKKHIGPYIASGKRIDGVSARHMFLPGGNRVPLDVWNKIKDAQGVKRRLEDGEFTILSAPDEAPHSIADENSRSAVAMAKRTIDPELLERWLTQELSRTKPRVTVLDALRSQLGEVENDPAERGTQVMRDNELPAGIDPTLGTG
jgi:hypothetical protein